MKDNVKIDRELLGKVRKESKKKEQTIGGYIELAVKQALSPQYGIWDNCDAFRKYLDDKKIKWRSGGHSTIVIDVADPIKLGMEWGVYEHLNKPK